MNAEAPEEDPHEVPEVVQKSTGYAFQSVTGGDQPAPERHIIDRPPSCRDFRHRARRGVGLNRGAPGRRTIYDDRGTSVR